MTRLCSWCLNALDAPYRTLDIDAPGTLLIQRFFCSTQHQANWETRQPAPKLDVGKFRGLPVEVIVNEANARGFAYNNLFQYQVWGSYPTWRANLQAFSPEGTSLSEFSDYADGASIGEAAWGALLNMSQREDRKGTLRREGKQASEKDIAEMWKLFQRVVEKWAGARP